VIAHRGASEAEPPGNTLPAFRAAAALGADWVELDVRRTADGGLAVHHDAELADGRPIVALAAADLPSEVPSLAAALDACAGMGVNVEIKNAPVDPDWDESRRIADDVVRVLAGRDPEGLLVTSFDPGTLDRVRALDRRLPTGLLVHPGLGLDDAVALAAERGHRAVHPWDPTVTEALVSAAHRRGLAVNVWTVNDPGRMRTLAAWGVDGIITDRPDLARAVVG
jgi:glycerophosphoryl diester phosphodiesterase